LSLAIVSKLIDNMGLEEGVSLCKCLVVLVHLTFDVGFHNFTDVTYGFIILFVREKRSQSCFILVIFFLGNSKIKFDHPKDLELQKVNFLQRNARDLSKEVVFKEFIAVEFVCQEYRYQYKSKLK
jgi:hypothetical protein